MSSKKQELFILQGRLCSSLGFGGVRVVTYISNTRVSSKKQEVFILRELLCSSSVFGGGGGGGPCCYIYKLHDECLIRSRNCLSVRSLCVHPRFLVGSVLLHI